MLRACRRVLKPGGRVAFLTYFGNPGHGHEGVRDSLTASAGGSEHQAMLEASGFTAIVEYDLTAQFLSTAKAWYDWRQRYAGELIAAEGEAAFREKQSTYLDHVRSVQAGVRSRCLFLARRP